MVRCVMTQSRVVALTFDLCELETVTTGYDAAVIDYLRAEAIPATLFLGGKWMRTHAVRTKQLMTDPLFEIGSHAWSHGNFGIMSEQSMCEQIAWTDAEYAKLRAEILRDAATPEEKARARAIPRAMRFFRLPYGRTSELGLQVLSRAGFEVVQWSVSGDSVLDLSPEEEGRATALRVNPGGILLFHANRVPKNAPEILRAAVETLRRLGYRFVSVSTLLTLGEPYRTRSGYFEMPGDNLDLDGAYGIDGTGRKA